MKEESTVRFDRRTLANGEQGAIGYILLWAMGVPVSLLFLAFLLRGCT